MRYLVTGSGLLGSQIAAALAGQHELVVVDSRPPRTEVAGRFIEGDVRDPDVVNEAARDVDGIFHTAALHGIHVETNSPTEFMSVNTVGTFNVVEAALRNGVKRVVFSSSQAVRPGDTVPTRVSDVYGLTKLFGEQMLDFYRPRGVEGVALRYGAIRQLVAQQWGLNFGWALGAGLTDIRDAVAANIGAMTAATLPQAAYEVVPAPVLTPADVERHGDPRAALIARLPWLADHDLPEKVPAPRSAEDTAITERDLGFRFVASQEDYLKEAAGVIPNSSLDLPSGALPEVRAQLSEVVKGVGARAAVESVR